MEKMLIEAIYELTQAVQILALKVDELDQTTTSLVEHKLDVKVLGAKLSVLLEKMEQPQSGLPLQ